MVKCYCSHLFFVLVCLAWSDCFIAKNYHGAGPCKLWWPLNHTDIHVLPKSTNLAEHDIGTELIITCAALEFVRFESLVTMLFGEDGQASPLRAGIYVQITDISAPLGSREPSIFRISSDWNPNVPLILTYDLAYTQNVSHEKAINVQVCYSDGTCFSEFETLTLHTVNVAYPRWEMYDNSTLESDDVGWDDKVAMHDQQSLACESRYFDYVPAFVNSIANRDDIGQWLPVLLPPDITATGSITLAEIGVQRADYSLGALLRGCGALCRHWLLVDVWDEQNLSTEEYIDSANESQQELAAHYDIVQEKAGRLMNNADITVTLMRNSSVVAANELSRSREAAFWRNKALHDTHGSPKYSIDFVYLDARHDYFSVVEDICAWFPLVSPGGILAGHDYMRSRFLHGTLFTVRQAVDKFAFDMGIELRTTREVEIEFPTWFLYRPRVLSALQRANFRRFCTHTRHM